MEPLLKMLEKTKAITNILSKGFKTVQNMPSTERLYWFLIFLATIDFKTINDFLNSLLFVSKFLFGISKC